MRTQQRYNFKCRCRWASNQFLSSYILFMQECIQRGFEGGDVSEKITISENYCEKLKLKILNFF